MFNIRKWLGLCYYVSPLDEFLHNYQKQHPKQSASQQQEVKKYQRIFKKRDGVQVETTQTPLWEQF